MALAYLGRSSTFKRCLALLSLETAFTTSEVLQVGSRVKRKCPLKLACNSLLVDAREHCHMETFYQMLWIVSLEEQLLAFACFPMTNQNISLNLIQCLQWCAFNPNRRIKGSYLPKTTWRSHNNNKKIKIKKNNNNNSHNNISILG